MNYGYLTTEIGIIKVTCDSKVKKIQLVGQRLDDDNQSNLTRLVIKELGEYFLKEREDFSFLDRLDFDMTGFQKEVLMALLYVGYGKTATYKDIARNIGRDRAYRAVGSAISKNPFLIVIPCHRIIRSDGRLGGFFYGPDVKARLLELER